MTWLAYIGPGTGGSYGFSPDDEWAMRVALAAFALLWWALLRRERMSEWCCLVLALLGAICIVITTHACLVAGVPTGLGRFWSEWNVLLLALVLLAAAFAALGSVLLGLGRWLYGCEVPAAIARASQRPWPPGAR